MEFKNFKNTNFHLYQMKKKNNLNTDKTYFNFNINS